MDFHIFLHMTASRNVHFVISLILYFYNVATKKSLQTSLWGSSLYAYKWTVNQINNMLLTEEIHVIPLVKNCEKVKFNIGQKFINVNRNH
jgi:hypothetical protein